LGTPFLASLKMAIRLRQGYGGRSAFF